MMRIAIFCLALLVAGGCQAPRQRQRDSGPAAGAFVAPQGLAAAPGAPVPVAPGLPAPAAPAPFPTVPQNAGPPNVTPSSAVPPLPTPGANGKVEANWQPAEARSPFEGRVLLAPPEPIPGESKETQKKLDPSRNETKQAAPALPAGIAQFAHVTPKISAGLRPAAEDGLDWLRAKNYRTVVHLRLPGEKDEADRKEIEQRGLKYESIEVSPDRIAKESVDAFFQMLRDPERQPIFVYDRDGSLAGGMWYLWLRLAEEASDDVARIRARSLGLREDREGAHRDMWRSVQKYLTETKGS